MMKYLNTSHVNVQCYKDRGNAEEQIFKYISC